MAERLNLDMAVPIESVSLVMDSNFPGEPVDEMDRQRREMEDASRDIASAAQALEAAAGELKDFLTGIVGSHREQIVRLSVGIAEKILLREISAGNYDIATIVDETLKSVPSSRKVVVRLNPEDLAQYQKSRPQTGTGPEYVQAMADAQVNRGECIAEADKGIVEYFIGEQLKQIEAALLAGDKSRNEDREKDV